MSQDSVQDAPDDNGPPLASLLELYPPVAETMPRHYRQVELQGLQDNPLKVKPHVELQNFLQQSDSSTNLLSQSEENDLQHRLAHSGDLSTVN